MSSVRFPRIALSFLALQTLALGTAFGGSVVLEWDPSPDATGYNVHIGPAPGSYTDSRNVGNVTETEVNGLGDCALHYFAATAYNDAGESEPSNEVSSWPRPSVDSATPAQGQQGARLDVVLRGLNYQPGAVVEFSNPEITLNSSSVSACGELTANITIGAGAAVGPVDVSVSNASGITGTGVGVFSVTADSRAPVISGVDHRDVTHRQATIVWTTDEPADSQVFYREIGSGTYLETPVDAAMVLEHSVVLDGLSPETTHEYHVRSVDAGGNAATSEPDLSFTTAPSLYTYIVFEAEAGDLGNPMKAASGAGAFAGRWIDTPAGLPRGGPTDPLGTATFGVNVPEGGNWTLWVRMYGPDAASNSFFEAMDGIGREILSTTGLGAWEWVRGRTYTLNAGLHDLELGGREAASRADRVLLTNDPDFVPVEAPGADVSPPASVTELVATPASGVNALAWTNPADADLARTVIRYRTDGRYPVSPWDGLPAAEQEATPGAADSFIHDGLTDGVTYYYGVFAVDRADNVAAPARIASTPGGPEVPRPPGNLRVVRR